MLRVVAVSLDPGIPGGPPQSGIPESSVLLLPKLKNHSSRFDFFFSCFLFLMNKKGKITQMCCAGVSQYPDCASVRML